MVRMLFVELGQGSASPLNTRIFLPSLLDVSPSSIRSPSLYRVAETLLFKILSTSITNIFWLTSSVSIKPIPFVPKQPAQYLFQGILGGYIILLHLLHTLGDNIFSPRRYSQSWPTKKHSSFFIYTPLLGYIHGCLCQYIFQHTNKHRKKALFLESSSNTFLFSF